MDLKEIAELVNWTRDYVTTAIETGVELPVSKVNICIHATKINGMYEVTEEDLDRFFDAFEKEQPGRKPPVIVMRRLRVEAGHRCAICHDSAPLEFHHIIEFAKLNHHDPDHMLAICPNCHTLCSTGKITVEEQKEYKKRLANVVFTDEDFNGNGPIRFNWNDLQEIITSLHETVKKFSPNTNGKYDFTYLDLEQKNALNGLGGDYFSVMRNEHEPYFGIIDEFLRSPASIKILDSYLEIVEELRAKIAADQRKFGQFEKMLIEFMDAAIQNMPSHLSIKRKVLHILISFMYFNCDIGRKV
jgi:hypothetical protein